MLKKPKFLDMCQIWQSSHTFDTCQEYNPQKWLPLPSLKHVRRVETSQKSARPWNLRKIEKKIWRLCAQKSVFIWEPSNEL